MATRNIKNVPRGKPPNPKLKQAEVVVANLIVDKKRSEDGGSRRSSVVDEEPKPRQHSHVTAV